MYARTNKRKTRRTTRAKAPATRTRRYTKRTRKPATTRNPAGARGAFLGFAKPTVQRGYLPFNQSYMARLPFAYDDYITNTAAFSALAQCSVNHTFRLNSVYDPLYNVGGFQPVQYAQLALFYGAYTVFAVKVNVTFYNPTQDGMNCGIRMRLPGQNATHGMPLSNMQEAPRAIVRRINNTGSQKTDISFYIRTRDVYGINHIQYQDGYYSSSTTGNPAAPVPLLEPWAMGTTGSDTTIRCAVKLIYYVKFFDPVGAGPSE